MNNKKEKSHFAAKSKDSSRNQGQCEELAALSPESAPFVLSSAERGIVAAIKLERVTLDNRELRLAGWLLGHSDLTISCNGTPLPSELRRIPRPDVAEAFPDSAELATGFELSARNVYGGKFMLRWLLNLNGNTLNYDFSLPIKELEDKPSQHPLGYIDQLIDRVMAGWAWNPDRPDERVQVEFFLDGASIGQANCDIFRGDLRAAGIGDGAYGFEWRLPEHVDAASANRIQVRIHGSQHKLSGQVSPIFSRLSATFCLDGDIDFSWPFYVSGTLVPTAEITPDRLEIISQDKTVAIVETVPDQDVKSVTYGAVKFKWEVPETLRYSAPARIKIPGCGTIALANSTSPACIRGGRYSLVGNTLHGRIERVNGSSVKSVPIRVVIDLRRAGETNVHFDRNGVGRFSLTIPQQFMTGEEYFVGVYSALDFVVLTDIDGNATTRYRATATGVVDKWNPPFLSGWAIDFSSPNHTTVVQLFDGETLIAETPCSLTRQDVSKKFGVPGLFGFDIAVPTSVYNGRPHKLQLKCNGIQLACGSHYNLPPSMDANDLKAIPAAQRIRGRVEQLTTEMVAGWAWDSMNPESPVELLIRVDGQTVGTTKANRFSARLRGEGRSGHQLFVFQLPSSLQNGTKRHVSVVEVNTLCELINHVSPISFPLHYLPKQIGLALSWNYQGNCLSASGRQEYVRYNPASPVTAKTPRKAQPRISMIALNWNGDLMLEDFLTSLEQNQPRLPYELIIVDHGSTDCSTEIIQRYADRLPIRLLERRANYSFSSSNNYAVSLATGDYLLFLNNDLIFQHDCVGSMAELLISDGKVGVVGARLLEPIKEANGSWSFEPHHEGVRFKIDTLPGSGAKYYAPQEINGIPTELSRSVLQMPVITAALMMCRKSDFVAVGGFCEDYFYGLEDVDLCLKISHQLEKLIVCNLNASAIHNRSATRDSKFLEKQATKLYTADIHSNNRSKYIRRFGRQLTRRVLRSLLDGSSFYRRQPLRVTFAVTEADINTAAGDYFTALELGIWLQKKFGWEICFVKIGSYSIPGTDVLVAMRHDYNIRKLVHGNPGLVTVAWIRNRTDQWLEQPEFNDYNLIFASSQKTIDHLDSVAKKRAILLPIATNPDRFNPDMAAADYASDLVFTGSYHGAVRGAVAMLNLESAPYQFAIYGYNWDKSPLLSSYCRGSIRYDSLGKAYASSKLVIDDSHPVTREWNSLNSRIFDAIACGKVVITNCVDGAKELFGEMLPTFSTRNELNTLVDQLLNDDAKRDQLANALRENVLANHTYANRADTFLAGLRGFLTDDVLRFSIKIGVPRPEELEQWGDYHFALGLKRAIERQGHFVRVDILPDWDSGLRESDDVVIVLRGLSRYKPQPTAVNILWLISHPDDVSIAEMREYDHVFVASELYAARLAPQLNDKVSPLLQCTDPEVFFPETDETLNVPEILFVGNSRGQRREVVQHALSAGIDFGVFGGAWNDILPQERVLGEYIPNQDLHHYYSKSKVLLNDHWPDMRREGFLSNRLFDAGACGALILSDDVEGLSGLFGDAILTYSSAESFTEALDRCLSNSDLRRELGNELMQTIRANHTFDHRAAVILGVIAKIHQACPVHAAST